MYRHLFIEGPIQTGKSTLLKNFLQPYSNDTAGFTCQRLTDKNGQTIAFRLGSADSTPLTAPYSPAADNIFRIIAGEKKGYNNINVFDTAADLINAEENKRIILLDEIGGIEMLNESFRATLYNTLAGTVPCIGVLQQKNNAAAMSTADLNNESISFYNNQLRQAITQNNGVILEYKRNDTALQKKIKDFLSGVFPIR